MRLPHRSISPYTRPVCVALFTGLLLGGAPASAAVNWPQSFHDSHHSGFNPQETTLSVSNVPNLQLLWGQGVAGGVTGFALAQGKVFAQGQGDSNGANLAAIDATSGAALWTITTGNDGYYLNGTVAVGSGFVFSGCGFKDTGGTNYGAVCAYRPSNGKRMWAWSAPCNCLPEGALQSPLVYANGAVYFGYANGGAGGSEYIVAADAASGAVFWEHVTGGPNSLGTAPLAVFNNAVYFGCTGAHNFAGLCAASQSDGSSLWAADLGATPGAITASGSRIFVNVCNGSTGLVTLNASTGATLWSYGASECNQAPVAVAGGDVYFLGGSGQMYDLGAGAGHLRWSGAQTALSGPSIANGVLYENGGCCYTGTFPAASAWDASNGALLWTADHPQSTLNPPPIVANGTLYFANGPCGSICAYGLTGRPGRR